MQRLLSFAIVLMAFTMNVNAQADTLRYFVDYYNKKCPRHLAYFYRVQMREGNLWYLEDYYAREQVLQMTGRYLDDSLTKPEGVFYYYHKNSKLEGVSRYKNGLLEGLSMHYDSTGKILDSTFYKKGHPSGSSFGWGDNGLLNYRGIFDEEGRGTGEVWHYHDNGKLCCYGKKSAGNLPDSVWTFYGSDGSISCKDSYVQGKYKKRVCYNVDDSTKTVKCKESGSMRPLFRELWKKYVSLEDSVSTCKEEMKGKKGRFLCEVCMEIDGKVSVSVIQPFYPCFDNFVINLLKGATTRPPIGHNRPERVCESKPIDFN